MTQRLYYTDSYTTDFTAHVLERLTLDSHPALVLDRTYFYPTGGGQPHDTGLINGVPVIDVQTRDDDGVVLHVLERDVAQDDVECHIDWARRFDHMQHHTGQHILTQAFIQAAQANTVSFHLSADSVTIDVDKTDLTPGILAQVEDLANQILYENRPVTIRLVAPDDAEEVRVRRKPGKQLYTDGLRVVEIQDFDQTACGGTHVAYTGEIGLIKIVKLERRGDTTRVEFRCGWRALRDYRDKHQVITRLANDFNCRYYELDQAIANLREEGRQAARTLKAARDQLMDYEAERLLANTTTHGDLCVVKAAYENRDIGELRVLASKLSQTPGVVALLGTAGDKAHILLARSADLPHDLNPALKQALSHLGDARGGGQPHLTQGGGVNATLAQVQAALDEAERSVLEG